MQALADEMASIRQNIDAIKTDVPNTKEEFEAVQERFRTYTSETKSSDGNMLFELDAMKRGLENVEMSSQSAIARWPTH